MVLWFRWGLVPACFLSQGDLSMRSPEAFVAAFRVLLGSFSAIVSQVAMNASWVDWG